MAAILQQVKRYQSTVAQLQQELDSLTPFKEVRDVKTTVDKLRQLATMLRTNAEKEANHIQQEAEREAAEIRKNGNAEIKAKRQQIEVLLTQANQQADQIIRDATERAEQIAGDAYRALKEADLLQDVAKGMKNVINGYGDHYLKPTYSLLDELAEMYGFDQAGQELKQARERSKLMVEHDRAAVCDYVEKSRRETAVRFVLDAFTGKVDSILSRSKTENFGILEQQIRDAFALVNYNGRAFRNARITEEYLQARLTELKWLTAVQVLRDRQRKEQRRIRDQIREEEKSRREIERALKETVREEQALQKAMQTVQEQVAKASEAQRAMFEAQLADIQAKLAEAEARNQRALSMAQQTKAGHVYIISNVGSFGENMFKVGMTRRLEPLERIRELSDASVPFAFDVHAMIWCEDAPFLERELHRYFARAQVNKVNPRKEFFRVSLTELRQHIDNLGVDTHWTMTAIAAEYRESLAIEQRLQENSQLADEWLRQQMKYDPTDWDEDDKHHKSLQVNHA